MFDLFLSNVPSDQEFKFDFILKNICQNFIKYHLILSVCENLIFLFQIFHMIVFILF